MKYYYAFFRDNNTSVDPNGQLYKVVIYTKMGEGNEKLLLSGSPFTVTYESSEDIYKPYKCSTATIGFLNREFIPELNSIGKKDVEVFLLKLREGVDPKADLDNLLADILYFDVEWAGYGTPNVYTQGYNSYLDEFQLECQDKLSMLKYLNFETTYMRDDDGISLYDLLKFNVQMPLKLTDVCVTDNIRTQYGMGLLDIILKGKFLKSCGSVLEALEKVLYHLNLTIVQVKNRFYIISYDAIKNRYATYKRISDKRTVTIEHEVKNLEECVSASNNTNMSLNTVYGQIKIGVKKDELGDFRPSDVESRGNKIDYKLVESPSDMVSYSQGRILGGYNTFKGLNRFDSYLGDANSPSYTSVTYLKYYGLVYNDNTNNTLMVDCFCRGKVGYQPGQLTTFPKTSGVNAYSNRLSTPVVMYNRAVSDEMKNTPVNDILFKQCNKMAGFIIYSRMPQYNHKMADGEMTSYYMSKRAMQVMPDNQPEIMRITSPFMFVGDNDGILFNFSYTYFDDVVPSNNKDSAMNEIPVKNEDYEFFAVKFVDEEGNWYVYSPSQGWHESSHGYAIKTSDVIPIYLQVGGSQFGSKIGVRDTNTLTDDKGFLIASPSELIKGVRRDPMYCVKGKFIIQVLPPFGVGSRISNVSTLVSDISLKVISDKEDYSGEDIVYTCKIDDSFYETLETDTEMSGIMDSKENVANALLTVGEGSEKYRNLDYIFNISTGDAMTPEEMLLKAYLRQCSKQQISFNTDIHDASDMLDLFKYKRFKDKKFIVNKITVDYKYHKYSVNLVEKL